MRLRSKPSEAVCPVPIRPTPTLDVIDCHPGYHDTGAFSGSTLEADTPLLPHPLPGGRDESFGRQQLLSAGDTVPGVSP